MRRRSAIRLVFVGVAIVLVSWWAADDGRISGWIFENTRLYAFGDFVEVVLEELKLGLLIGGLIVLYGGYRFITAESSQNQP